MLSITVAAIYSCVVATATANADETATAKVDDIAPEYVANPYIACGVNCLYAAASIDGLNVSLDEVFSLARPESDGSSTMAELLDAAKSLGLQAAAFRLENTDSLADMRTMAILHVKHLTGQQVENHFVLFLGVEPDGRLLLLDPPYPPEPILPSDLQERWSGSALILTDSAESLRAVEQRIRQRQWRLRREPSFWTALALLSLFALLVVSSRWPASRSHANAKFLFVPALALLSGGCGSSGSPQLVFDQPLMDFGMITGDSPELDIVVRNEGEGPLKITEVATTCNCTVVKSIPHLVSGESGTITMSVPANVSGPQSARISVKSNDPNGPHEILVRWYGESTPHLVPSHIVLSNVAPGSEVEKTVKIAYAGGDPEQELTVRRVDSSRPDFKIEVIDSTTNAIVSSFPASNTIPVLGETTLRFTCRVAKDTVNLDGHCTIYTELAGEEFVFNLPVHINSTQAIVPSPSTVFLSANELAGFLGKLVRVVVRSGSSTEELTVSAPGFLEIVDKESINDRITAVTFEVVETPTNTKDEYELRFSRDGLSCVVPVKLYMISE